MADTIVDTSYHTQMTEDAYLDILDKCKINDQPVRDAIIYLSDTDLSQTVTSIDDATVSDVEFSDVAESAEAVQAYYIVLMNHNVWQR